MRILIIAGFLALISGCANHQQKAQDEIKRYLGISKEEYKALITIKDDPLETIAVLSTQAGFKQKHGLANVVWNDFFLRGYIDKTTGVKSIQVYAALEHISGTWLHPYQANYGKPLKTTPVTKIGSDVDCSASNLYGSCKYLEHVGFTLAQEELIRIEGIIKSDPTNQFWIFKLKTRAGNDIIDGFTKNEFAALIEKMNEYKPVETQ